MLTLSPLSLELASGAKIIAHWLTTGLPLVLLSPVLGLLLNLPAPGYFPLFVSLLIGTPGAVGGRRDRGGAYPVHSPRRPDPGPDRAPAPYADADLRRGRRHGRPGWDRAGRIPVSRSVFNCRRGAFALCCGGIGSAQHCRMISTMAGRSLIKGQLAKGVIPMALTMTRITVLANPKRFLDYSKALLPWTGGLAFVLLAVGFYWALFGTPPDYQQGQTVKMMFVHVPGRLDGHFRLLAHRRGLARQSRVPPSLVGRRREVGRPLGGRVHRPCPLYRVDVGPPDVGHLLAVGRCAARLRADPALHLSRLYRALERGR